MKKFWFALCFSLLTSVLTISAQDPSAAAAMADRRDIEERFKRLDSAVEELFSAHNALQGRLVKFQTELRSLREEMDKQKASTPKYASQDDLQRLLLQVQEIDKRRESDLKMVVEELRKLSRTPPPPTKEKETSKNHSAPPKSENAFEYTIRSGDTISQIIYDLRKQGLKVTEKMILDANPGLKPDKLIVGKKIRIPDTKSK